jgi:predicted GNAT family acetyltransferase
VEQGIYALTTVVDPPEPAGASRLAGPADRNLLLQWIDDFAAEVLREGPQRDPGRHERSIDVRLGSGDAGFALWEVDGAPVSLVGFGGRTPNGIRVGPVYTPPEHRGRGYASALTARVSRLQLDRGKQFCFLYTDLANPTSNAIYTRIGYERICDSREIVFSGNG